MRIGRPATLVLTLALTLAVAGCATAPPKKTLAERKAERAKAAAAATAAATKPAAPPRARMTGTPEDARKHMLRGMAAIEMAKSPEELAMAEEEFLAAADISPRLGSAWFNLGKVQTQLGRYDDAIASYRQYLVVAPGAEDAQKVRDEIVKLEFRQEQVAREKGRAGSWITATGAWYSLVTEGGGIVLKTDQRRVTEEEVLSTYTLVGSVPIYDRAHAEHRLTARGNRLAGTWSRGPVPANECQIPPDTAEVAGEVNDRERKMTLRYEVTTFSASTQLAILGADYCTGVAVTGKKGVEEVLYGPLGPAALGPGVTLMGLYSWWAGGFSSIQQGWQGHLGVRLDEETEAYEAGLRNEDEILAIDGVPVKSLNAGEAMLRLYGQPGTPVRLDILREKEKTPIIITIQRIPNV
ncbi:PDZ domain-containing protein [Geobacter sp. FeAm09]|uniref:tetratricopeptide repeat protein n=1 Tax=Geobacter sp. FeAm09 TaxID=2597769 RepID=UPI0011EF30A5|nr:tetratricopeptide repeat protein [Geobacter sp. FeAm09]QEM67574.1 PDZ domain-containing protein [Geobacter sp. FeAm09]